MTEQEWLRATDPGETLEFVAVKMPSRRFIGTRFDAPGGRGPTERHGSNPLAVRLPPAERVRFGPPHCHFVRATALLGLPAIVPA
jgi:hypothetical protein